MKLKSLDCHGPNGVHVQFAITKDGMLTRRLFLVGFSRFWAVRFKYTAQVRAFVYIFAFESSFFELKWFFARLLHFCSWKRDENTL